MSAASFVLAVLLAACQSPAPRMAKQGEGTTNVVTATPPADLQFAGKIIRVNSEHGYVVVECASLPNTDEEARVLRGESEVGRVRFTAPFSYPFATADVIAGRPEAGDRVRK